MQRPSRQANLRPRKTKPGSWNELLALFLASAVDSPHTRHAYRRYIAAAPSSLGGSRLKGITGIALAKYRACLLADGRGDASHAQALAAMRAFLTWAAAIGLHSLTRDAIGTALKLPRVSRSRPPRVLRESEIARFLAAASSSRDRALLGVLIGCGLRAAEVASLDARDVVKGPDGRAALYVRRGKGRKDRVVPLGKDVERPIRKYLAEAERPDGDSGPLFRSHDRGAQGRESRRISTRSVGLIVAKAAANVDTSVSPHSLRHSFALRVLRRGGSAVAVARLLGHANLTTTQRYCDHFEFSELREVMPALLIAGSRHCLPKTSPEAR
jgi:site-specific recombinase XerD